MHLRFEHATDDQLESYSLGTISGPDVEVLEEHLLICQGCQDRLTESDVFVRHMRLAAAKIRAETSREPHLGKGVISLRRWSAPILAALAIFCFLGVFWLTSARKRQTLPASVVLQTLRGLQDAPQANAPRGRPLRLEADLTGLQVSEAIRLEIVDTAGKLVWQSRAMPQGSRVALQVKPGLDPGAYWVRLYGAAPDSELLREYALRVQ
jgi:hypothetical protein